MVRTALAIAVVLSLAGGLISAALAAPATCYDWIARDKLRGGYLSSADLGAGIAQMKAVGMNTLLPKFGGLQSPPTEGNVTLLRRWGQAARDNHLHLLPVFNFRGGETEKLLSDRREVTIGGETMKLTPCPLDEQFWTRYIEGRMVYLAAHAAELGLDGGILDPEMYGADHTTFNTVCYCADCLREFCQTIGQAPPDPFPVPSQRAAWLKQAGLDQRFTEFFVARVRGFGEHIEREVHARNADFMLGVLLLDYPLPFMKGLATGLGTETHPVLGFSETTYSPGYTDYVDKQGAAFAAMPAHVLFVPGLWQQQFPSENLAEQYYACAAHSAGYWIYTFESLLEDVSKLPGYALREPPERYWAAMQTANEELDKLAASGGQYVSALKVRPFDPPLPVLSAGDIKLEALVPAPDNQPLSMGPVTGPRLRYRNPLFVLCKAGEPVVLKVTNLQLANYRPGSQWLLLDPQGQRLLEGHMKVRESAEVKFTPERDGVYVLVVSSGNNSHAVQVLTGQRFSFIAGARQRFIVNGSFGRVYFYVPGTVTTFSLFARAEGQAAGRGGKLTIFGPDKQAAAHAEGDLGNWTELAVTVPAGGGGRVWCLSAEDLTNDLTVYFSPNMPPYFTPDPTRVLTTGVAP